MLFVASIVCLLAFDASADFITKKFCKDVDQSMCTVFSLSAEPCSHGPAFCALKNNKKLALTVNMTPKFSAEKLKLSISADVQNDGTFSTIIQRPKDGCDYLTCPLQAEERRIFDIDMRFTDKLSIDNGKFPVQVKLWNEDDESQVCCLSFKVKGG